jgi:hypothetical protein
LNKRLNVYARSLLTALAERSRKIGLTNADVKVLERGRDVRPAEPMRFA